MKTPMTQPSPHRIAIRVLAMLAVVIVAYLVRARAVEQLPIDFDEDDYLRAGQLYAAGLQDNDWAVFTRENYRTEHPPLSKIAYGFAIAGLPPAEAIPDLPTTANPARALPQPHLTVARWTAATMGLLTTAALALLNPLAGLFLATNTWTIKYTSQVMLEGVPSLTSLLMVLFYLRSQGTRRVWLALSAMAFGLTVAAKYPYGLAALAVAGHWLWTTRPSGPLSAGKIARWWGPVAAWGAVAVLVFFLADPYLWPDPVNRLRESVLYHGGYAQSEAVKNAGFPVWQPLVWLTMGVPWHPGVFTVTVDALVVFFACLGVRRTWERQRVFAIWFGLVLAFLLMWTTKWPQYVLMLTAPLCVLAAGGVQAAVWEPLVQWWQVGRHQPRFERTGWRELLRATPWLLPGAATLIILTLFPVVYQFAVALTDFNTMSIRDGINDGVWRAVSQGLTGQAAAIDIGEGVRALKVRYVGPGLLLEVLNQAPAYLAMEAIWTVTVVAAQLALAVLVALLLHRQGVAFKGGWRAIFILPVAVPEFVGALIWVNLAEPNYGWIPLWLGRAIEWFRSPELSLLVLASGAVWMGWPLLMLAASAGLTLIPEDVYEAAALDGAGPWQRFTSLTWPMLVPLLAPALIVRAIYAFNQFYLFYVFGFVVREELPISTLATISYFYFSPTFGGQFAVSAAINIIIVLLLIVFVGWFIRRTRAEEGVTYA
jgi:ABC-type sugar transport system permease subunit